MNIMDYAKSQTTSFIRSLNKNYVCAQDVHCLIESIIEKYQVKYKVKYIPTTQVIRKIELAIEDQLSSASVSIKF